MAAKKKTLAAKAAAKPATRKAALEIRVATEDDLPAIHVIEKATFTDWWTIATFRSSMRQSHVRFTVALLKGEIVGYAAVWLTGEECELGNLAVDESQRGQGIGLALLREQMKHAAGTGAMVMFLEVRVSNTVGQALYEREGFSVVGKRKKYYTYPVEDALIMRRDLP